jgi:hypothetical protein
MTENAQKGGAFIRRATVVRIILKSGFQVQRRTFNVERLTFKGLRGNAVLPGGVHEHRHPFGGLNSQMTSDRLGPLAVCQALHLWRPALNASEFPIWPDHGGAGIVEFTSLNNVSSSATAHPPDTA